MMVNNLSPVNVSIRISPATRRNLVETQRHRLVGLQRNIQTVGAHG